MKRKLYSIVILLFVAQFASAAGEFKDWQWSEKSINGKQFCSAETVSLDRLDSESTLTLLFPQNSDAMPQLYMTHNSEEISFQALKYLKMATDRTAHLDKVFYGQPVNDLDQKFFLPAWKVGEFIDEVIRHSRISVEVVSDNIENNFDIEFSLRGSSRVIKEMATECLNLETLPAPRTMDKFVNAEQAIYIESIGQAQPPRPSFDLALEKFLEESLFLEGLIESGFSESLVWQDAKVKQETATSNVNRARSQLRNQRLENSELRSKINQIQRDKETLPAERDLLVNKIESDEVLAEDIRDEFNAAKRNLNSVKSVHKELSQRKVSLEENVNFYKNERNRLSRLVQNTQSSLDDSDRNLDRYMAQLNRIERESNLPEKRRELVRSRERLSDLEQQLNNFDRNRKINKRLRGNDKYQRNQRELDRLLPQQRSLQVEVDRLQANLDSARQRKSHLENRIGADRNRLRNIDQKTSELNTKKQETAQKKLADIFARNQENKKLADLRRDYRAQCGDRGRRSRECRRMKRNISGVEKNISTLGTAIANADRAISRINQEISTNESLKGTLPGQIAENERKLRRVTNNLPRLRTQKREKSEQLRQVKRQASTFQTENNEIRNRVTRNVDQRLANLRQNVNVERNTVNRLTADVNRVSRQVSDLQSKINNEERSQRQLQDKLSRLRAEQRNVNQDYNAAKSSLDRLLRSPEYRNSRDRLSQAQTRFNRVEGRYTNVNNRLADNRAKVRQINDKLSNGNKNLPGLQRDLTNGVNRIGDLEISLARQERVLERRDQDLEEAQTRHDSNLDRILSADAGLEANL